MALVAGTASQMGQGADGNMTWALRRFLQQTQSERHSDRTTMKETAVELGVDWYSARDLSLSGCVQDQ